jgi:hypothetical protein
MKKEKYPSSIHESGKIHSIEFNLSNGNNATVDVLSVFCITEPEVAPTVVIPGFTEGIVQDADFAKSLSDSVNGDVFVIGQYDRKSKGAISPKNALESQALAVLAVLEHVYIERQPIHIFANSMGAQVFARVLEMVNELSLPYFDKELGAKIILMAPAGIKQDDSMPKIAKRFTVDGGPLGGAHLSTEDGWSEESLKAGSVLIKSDPLKYASEGLLAAKHKVKTDAFEGLELHVLTSPSDAIFGQEQLGSTIVDALNDGYVDSWSSPWSPESYTTQTVEQLVLSGLSKKEAKRKMFATNQGAEHNTHMVNIDQAYRTAEAVASIIKN